MCQAAGSSTIENIVQLGSGKFRSYVAMNLLIVDHLAVVIIFEHSFYIYDKRRYLQDQQKSDPSYYLALEQYMASPHAAAVKEGVSAAVQAYEEAVTAASHAYEEATRTAVYPYEGNLPTWMTKLPFKPFKRKAKEAFEGSREEEKRILSSQAKAELSKNILAITLNHRMRMFHHYVVATVPLICLSSARPQF
ncbi:uncharacterized protein EDB93DRAFT_755102 [Suillus bovinus]|uniref:uncharacterized protein n=1 Tax=Suillus bovinus TaxID=48563 RepID=UPI001B8624DB|nr:uncharacterized protein EDB93DRAFT_755102 [Suillus bovinus]KAG2137877.1 hypothetical protein EDB93DRAFT_755102 [Suillus bovinus]